MSSKRFGGCLCRGTMAHPNAGVGYQVRIIPTNCSLFVGFCESLQHFTLLCSTALNAETTVTFSTEGFCSMTPFEQKTSDAIFKEK
jgi:hypothetical protein